MRLGSIVGIVLSSLIIIAGIVLCSIGASEANAVGQSLFTEKNDDGTYYCHSIEEGTTRLDINVTTADIEVVGGTGPSKIEFFNFNPNFYALTVTPNVVSFEEVQKIESFVDIWENGINFKGLRYALDPNNFSYDSSDKRIVITIGSDIDVKILDLSADVTSIDIKDLSFGGDITVKAEFGDVSINSLVTSSTVEIFGNSINVTVRDSSALSIKCTAKQSNSHFDKCISSDCNISVDNGRVDYITDSPISDSYVNVSTEQGGILINSLPFSGALLNEPESFTTSLKIKCKSAGINLSYPELTEDDSDGTVTESSDAAD